MRQFASVRIGFEFRAPPIGDVPDDGQHLAFVARDNARVVDALVGVGPERVLELSLRRTSR